MKTNNSIRTFVFGMAIVDKELIKDSETLTYTASAEDIRSDFLFHNNQLRIYHELNFINAKLDQVTGNVYIDDQEGNCILLEEDKCLLYLYADYDFPSRNIDNLILDEDLINEMQEIKSFGGVVWLKVIE